MNSASKIIQERFNSLNDKYNILWDEMMAEVTGEAKMSKIHDMLPIANEMAFISGLQNIVTDERKEATEICKMSIDILNESVNIVDRLISKVPKGHIPCDVYEDAYQLLKNYKNEHTKS